MDLESGIDAAYYASKKNISEHCPALIPAESLASEL
jgi:hypothetical protein